VNCVGCDVPVRREARSGSRSPEPLAPPQGRVASEGGDRAQKHPHDWAHGLRENRDRAPAGEARRCAFHKGEPYVEHLQTPLDPIEHLQAHLHPI
jgi:hypothetical protein